MESFGLPEDLVAGINSKASYRASAKIVGGILGAVIVVGGLFEVIGHPMLAGMTLALGFYLVISSILFITIPLLVLDYFD